MSMSWANALPWGLVCAQRLIRSPITTLSSLNGPKDKIGPKDRPGLLPHGKVCRFGYPVKKRSITHLVNDFRHLLVGKGAT